MSDSDSERIKMRYDLGKQLLEKGEINEAIMVFQGILAENPEDIAILYKLGVCHFRLHQFSESEKIFRSVIRLNHQNHLAHYYLGLSLERQNQIDQSIEEYKIALNLQPDFDKAREKLKNFEGHSEKLADKIEKKEDKETKKNSRKLAGNLIYEGKRRMRSFGLHFIIILGSIITILFTMGNVYEQERGLFLIMTGGPTFLLWILLIARSRSTRYKVFENRIDLKIGIFFRKERSIWVYQIEDVWLTRSPINILTNDATIHLRSSGLEAMTRRDRKLGGHFKIRGLGNYQFMFNLWTELRDAGLVERRAMKKWWV